jgi:hypothetical protein
MRHDSPNIIPLLDLHFTKHHHEPLFTPIAPAYNLESKASDYSYTYKAS